MAINPFFDKYNVASEQALLRDLCEEAIQINGLSIYYIPRVNGESFDLFLGEDPLAKFQIAAEMEAYVADVQGWEGQGDLVSKFVGLQLNDKITFTIARHRWIEEITAKLLSETGGMFALEGTDPEDGILLEDGQQRALPNPRPREGDLIWAPMIGKLFAVRFVEHEKMFYPLGTLLTYDMTCELYEYSSERLDTGVAGVDDIEDDFSTDMLRLGTLRLEDNTDWLDEDAAPLLEEPGTTGATRPETHDVFANNEIIQQLSDLDLIFDTLHPFQYGQRI